MSIGGSNADGSLGDCAGMPEAWPYFTYMYSTAIAGKVVVGGDSEPLSIVRLEVMLAVTPVSIDIKPGGEQNSINLGSAGVLTVAILGSDTFDAASVDPDTISLAGASVMLVGKSGWNSRRIEDANHACEDREAALDKANAVVEKLTSLRLKEPAQRIQDGIAETLTYCSFQASHWRRIRMKVRD